MHQKVSELINSEIVKASFVDNLNYMMESSGISGEEAVKFREVMAFEKFTPIMEEAYLLHYTEKEINYLHRLNNDEDFQSMMKKQSIVFQQIAEESNKLVADSFSEIFD